MMEDSAILVVLSARLKQCFQPLEKNSSAIWPRCEDIIAHAGYDSTMADKMKAVIGKALRKAFGSELRWKKYRRHDGSRRNRYNLLPINPYPDIKPPPITYGIMGGYAKSSSERSEDDAGDMHKACHSLSIAHPTLQMGAGKNSGKIDSSSSGDSSITKGSCISEGKHNSRNIKQLNNWRPFPNGFAIECVDFSAPFGENCNNIVAGPSQPQDEAINPGRYIQQHYSRNDTEQKLLQEDSVNHACTSKSDNRNSSIYTLGSNQALQKSHILNQGSFTGYNKQDYNVGALEYEQESASCDEEMAEGMRRLAARHASEMNAYKQKMGRRNISKIPAHATIRHIPQDPSYYIENESLRSGFASEFIRPSPKTSFLDAGSRHRFPVTNDLNNAIDLSASNGRAAHAETNINQSQYSDQAPYHYIPHRRQYYFKDNNNTEYKPQSWAESTRISLQSQSSPISLNGSVRQHPYQATRRASFSGADLIATSETNDEHTTVGPHQRNADNPQRNWVQLETQYYAECEPASHRSSGQSNRNVPGISQTTQVNTVSQQDRSFKPKDCAKVSRTQSDY